MRKLFLIPLAIVLVSALIFGGCAAPAPAPTPAPAPASTPAPLPPPPPTLTPPPKPAIESLTYTNSEYGFSVEYPKDWEFEEGLMGSIVLFMGPAVKGGEFMINMKVISEELPEFPKVTLEDYGKLAEMGLKQAMENYQKVDERSATIAGLPSILLTYTTDSGPDMLMYTQVFFLRENVAYVITYAAPPEFHDEYAYCIDLAIGSFNLVSPPPAPAPALPENLTYTNSEYGFSMEYPGDWDVEEDFMGTTVAFIGPSVLGGAYLVNINVITEQLPKFPKITLEDYYRAAEMHQEKSVLNYKKVEEHRFTISGRSAMGKTFTATIEVYGDELLLKNDQAFLIKDDVAYVITYDVPVEFYDEYHDFFDLAISSFRFE